jgi:hypothetical protein
MLFKSVQLSFLIVAALLVTPASLSAEPFTMVYNSDWPPFSSGTGNFVDGILPEYSRLHGVHLAGFDECNADGRISEKV